MRRIAKKSLGGKDFEDSPKKPICLCPKVFLKELFVEKALKELSLMDFEELCLYRYT